MSPSSSGHRIGPVMSVLVSLLAACGGGGEAGTVGPPPADTLALATAYTLTLINGDSVPWQEPPPDERTFVTSGTITTSPDTFKVYWAGYVQVCPSCEPLPRLDSLYGPYTRNGPRSFVVMISADHPMDVSLTDAGQLLLREKVRSLGGIYDQVFTVNP